MLNQLLVEGGFAREAAGAPAYLYQEDFANYEQRARTEGRGLWSSGTCAGNITRRPPVVP
jgi:endonuclease YncB( thermonuclease family)